MSANRFQFITLILILVAIILSACQTANAPKIVTSGAWGRSSAKMAMAGAVYVVIKNEGKETDKLIGVSSPAAKMAEVHESFMDANGGMGMRPVEGGLEIPAGQTVELKPGGYHIMLMDLVKPLEVGTKIQVTLKFERSGEVVLDAEIRQQ